MASESELSRLRHAVVHAEDGSKLGKISEIFLNDRSQKVTCVTVAMGFLRSREVYVPFSVMDVTPERVTVRAPRGLVESAPRANGSGYLTRQQEIDLHDFYVAGGATIVEREEPEEKLVV